jgi:hypothetical protein
MTGIPRSLVPRSQLWARRSALLTAGVLVLMLAAWVMSDPVENLSTDWTAFDNAADRVFAGEDVYRPYDAEAEPLPYLYPPFALWLALPMALFGFAGSFIYSALLTGICLVVGLRWFTRARVGSPDAATLSSKDSAVDKSTGVAVDGSTGVAVDGSTGVIVGLASGAAISSTLIGQYSGIYALAVGGAAHAYSKDRHGLAGALLALLWLKPNLAIAVPVVLLWSRSWRVLRTFAFATTVLALSSLPFGLDQWSGFASNVSMMAELQEDGVVPFRKMVTILGSAQTTFGLDPSSIGALAIWLASTAVLGVAVLELWTRSSLEESPIRAFAALSLFVVAANPRLYFYDSTLVVLGGAGLWMAANVNGNAFARRMMPPLAALTWFFLWGGLFVSLNRVVGPLAGLMLVVSAVDHRFVPQVKKSTKIRDYHLSAVDVDGAGDADLDSIGVLPPAEAA